VWAGGVSFGARNGDKERAGQPKRGEKKWKGRGYKEGETTGRRIERERNEE